MELRFDATGMAFLCGEDVSPLAVADVLAKRVVQHGHSRCIKEGDGSLGELLLPQMESPLYDEMRVQEGGALGSCKVWTMSWYTPGLTRWWVLGCFLSEIYEGDAREQIGKLMSSSWSHWASWVEDLCPARVAFRSPIDRTGRDADWDRCVPEHTASTTGLLCWLLTNAHRTYGGQGRAYFTAMKLFVDKWVGDTDLELRVPLDKEMAAGYCFPGVRAPASLCASLPMDGAQIWVAPFLEQSEGLLRSMLEVFFTDVSAELGTGDSTLHVCDLLNEMYGTTELQWLA